MCVIHFWLCKKLYSLHAHLQHCLQLHTVIQFALVLTQCNSCICLHTDYCALLLHTLDSGQSGHFCPLSSGPDKAQDRMNQSIIDRQSGFCPEAWNELGQRPDEPETAFLACRVVAYLHVPEHLQLVECRKPKMLSAGVLTKLDIMDRGTDALGMLKNEVLRLRLGYVGVINRSQHDIQHDIPVQQARKNEADFFAEHAQYRGLSAQCGIPALSKRYACATCLCYDMLAFVVRWCIAR
jgi:hypothetical protein